MTSSVLQRVVEAALRLDLEQVPERVLAHAGHVIADTVGVASGGSRLPQPSRLRELDRIDGVLAAADSPGTGKATVICADLPATTAAHAAYLNATAGTFLEMDEGMRPTGHPGMHIVPAALAVAEQERSSGRDLLAAVLTGYEVTSRLFQGFRLRYPVHPHGHLGAIGAAVAVALLEDVDPVSAAFVAATSPVLSIWDACYEGATARNTWIGQAAEAAVRASTLVRAGFEGSATSLEASFGVIAADLVDEDVLTRPLDHAHLGITRNYFKVHSACALTHAAIEAAGLLELQDPRDILDVRVETVANNLKLDRQPQSNDLSGRFSLPYAVATSLTLHRSDPDAFTFRRSVAELAKRVTIVLGPDLEERWPEASPARVTVRTLAGTQTQTVDNPRGHHSRPISPAELRTKFDSLVDPAHADAWWTGLTALRDVADCALLLRGLP